MLFFQLMTRRYEHASTVLTSSKGFLVHHCHLVTIRRNSYRMRQHTELWQSLNAPQEPEPVARRRRARQEPTTS